ncbi:MAG: ABC transporter substrate-binding protein [Eubacteriales bacterium]
MKKFLVLFLVLLFVMTMGCSAQKNENQEVRIAEQYGIAYAPIQVMKNQKIIEKYIPGVKVQWEQLANTTAIREAMVANQLDVGFMAIPPFLIGWDKGMDWKIFTGLSSVPVGLVTIKDIHDLEDITDKDRIALPQPGSVQHILLSMACGDTFNDPHRLDNLLVTLSHPDGMNALLTGKEIKAHFTSTPYLQTELKNPGYHQILDGKEAFGGDFSFIVGVTTKKFHDQVELYNGLNQALMEAIDFINENPEECAGILKEYYDIPEEEILQYITSEDTWYSPTVMGTNKFAQFMLEQDYLTKTVENNEEIMWENVNVQDGQE